MGRLNKLTEGVFTEIVGTSKKHSKYDKFIKSIDPNSTILRKYKKEYETIINSNKDLFNRLAKLEEMILQIRSKESIMTGQTKSIKLSLVREYIYARYPFYRNGLTAKDIRVIVDKSEFWGDDLKKLIKNNEFMSKSVNKLIKHMDEEIDNNIHEYKSMIRSYHEL